MGAWGVKTFENDDAADWVYELEESDDLSVIEAALAGAEAEYLEAPVAACVLAAAEVVLAFQKKARPGFPENAAAWVAAHGRLNAGRLNSRAVKALDRVLGEQSELKELWEESGDFESWQQDVREIRAALGQDTASDGPGSIGADDEKPKKPKWKFW